MNYQDLLMAAADRAMAEADVVLFLLDAQQGHVRFRIWKFSKS